jgi:hypothetical protein
MIAWIRLYGDPGRTVMFALKRIRVVITRPGGDEGFMTIWRAEVVGRMVLWKQGVEKTMEFASAYETDIANLYGLIRVPRTWRPHGMPMRGIPDGKLFAEDIVVGHRDRKGQKRLLAHLGVGRGGY